MYVHPKHAAHTQTHTNIPTQTHIHRKYTNIPKHGHKKAQAVLDIIKLT